MMTSHPIPIEVTVNGRAVRAAISPSMRLIDFLRDELSLTGTKPGCREGECGACTVLIDGQPVNSCLALAINADHRVVTTVEGVCDSTLDPVQQSLVRHGAVQCGFCTPGMVMTIKAFHATCRARNVVPDREEIQRSLAGNLCRCTGYVRIIDAVEALFRDAR